METHSKCLVVFSGGQDSTVCLHWAIQNFKQVEAVFFRYGQRHQMEEEAAKYISTSLEIPLKTLTLSAFSEIGGNALIDTSVDINTPEGQLPNTFVPGRNLVFLTYAASLAYQKKITNLVTGVCETDYSGYPDCRLEAIQSLEKTLALGMEFNVKIHTPLMHLSKAQTVQLAQKLGAMASLAHSHTCYNGQFPPCGKCPACLLRENGFKLAKVSDPLLKRGAAKMAKKLINRTESSD